MAVMGASLENCEDGWRCFYSKPLQQDIAAEKVAFRIALPVTPPGELSNNAATETKHVQETSPETSQIVKIGI
jgi:hypothetical protein